jgi:hypothetical protein
VKPPLVRLALAPLVVPAPATQPGAAAKTFVPAVIWFHWNEVE